MKNRNFKKTLAIVIASAAVACGVAAVPVVSQYIQAQADTETTTSSSTDKNSQEGQGKGQPPKNSDGSTTPPEKPSGDNSNGGPGNGETPPDKPDGDNENGQQPGGGNGGPGSQSSSKVTYNAATTIKKSTTTNKKTYTSKKASQNALMVTGSKVKATVKNAKVTKSGSSNSGGDSDNFYGTNSAVLAKDGATLNIKKASIKTTADGANGTFSYGGNGGQNGATGDGTTINISDSKITTTGNNAGGIMTTGGGTTNATNLTISTSGTSSAAIRSDRGGGTVNVNKGTYTTSGTGSPAIYCTSNTSVKNAKLVSKASEGIVIEGKNTVTLKNTDLTANNTKLNGQATTYQAVMLYQSMSGDSAEGTAEFSATGGSITNKNGSVFYVTNTTANIDLNNVKITNTDKDNVLIKVASGAWGKSGSNGGKVTFTTKKQKLSGNITVDDSSTLTLKLTRKSSYTGSINSSGQAGTVKVTVNKGSTWKLTGDSYVSSLSGNGTIDTNGYKLYVNGTLYKG